MRLMNAQSLQKLTKDKTYPTSFEGQLNFRRSNEEKFQKRYFLLKGNLLFYFAKKSDQAPLGLIILEGYTVELSNEEDGYCFQLLRRSNGNVTAALTFIAGTAEALQNWLAALTNCSYEQLKISAESMAELATTDNEEKTGDTAVHHRDENDNPMPSQNPPESAHRAGVAMSTSATFEELHETFGQKIKEMLATSNSS